MQFWQAGGEVKLIRSRALSQFAGRSYRAADFGQPARCPFKIKC